MDRIGIVSNLDSLIKNDLVYKILERYADATLSIDSYYKVNFYDEVFIDLTIQLSFILYSDKDSFEYKIHRKRTVSEAIAHELICEDIKDEIFNIVYYQEKPREFIELHRNAQEEVYELINKLTKA